MTKKYRMMFLTTLVFFIITNFTNARQADLIISIKCPGKATAGQDLKTSIKVLVTNKGKIAANNFPVDLIISKDAGAPMKYAVYSAVFKEDALLLGGREFVKYLGPGETKAVRLNGNNRIPADIPTGSYFLGAIVDAGNSVVESDNSNNMDFCRIKVKGKDKPSSVVYKVVKYSNKLIVKNINKGNSNTIGKGPTPTPPGLFIPTPYPYDGKSKDKGKLRQVVIPSGPPPTSSIRRMSPDPAATAILFKLVKRTSRSTGIVRITGIVKNLGSGTFNSKGGMIYIYEGNRVKMSRPFLNIEPGKTKAFSFKRDWDISAKYYPTYQLVIKYDPGIFSGQHKNKYDSDLKNNKKSRKGEDINKLF